jgi:hypothetical protein
MKSELLIDVDFGSITVVLATFSLFEILSCCVPNISFNI